MTGSVFFDTSPLIYLVEDNKAFIEPISLFIADSIETERVLVTSVLSIAEFEIKPIKLGRIEVINRFNKILNSFFTVENVDWDVAKISASLRVKYKTLRAVDSLQLASAINYGCEYFITNDRKLKRIEEIQVKLIKDL